LHALINKYTLSNTIRAPSNQCKDAISIVIQSYKIFSIQPSYFTSINKLWYSCGNY